MSLFHKKEFNDIAVSQSERIINQFKLVSNKVAKLRVAKFPIQSMREYCIVKNKTGWDFSSIS